MTFDGPKYAGHCIACGVAVRDVLATRPDGSPARLGAQHDTMTEVEFLLSSGASTHITFCTTCAPQIRPAHFARIWSLVLDAFEASFERQGTNPNTRRHEMAGYMGLFIVDVLYRRRKPEEGGPPNQDRVLDRRGAAA